MKIGLTIRAFLTLGLSIGLVVVHLPLARRVAAADLNLKTEAQIKAEAALYDTAIREISRISTMKLSDPDQSKAAIATLKTQARNIRFFRSKLISIGLADASFASAVKAKAGSEQKTQQEFAAELAQDRTAILKLSAANSIKNAMAQKVQVDAALLRRVGGQLKQAAADIRAAKHNHADRTAPTTDVSTLATERASLLVVDGSTDLNNTLVVVACVVFPPLGLAVTLVAANAGVILFGELVAAAAAKLLLDLKANAGTDKQKDNVQACEDQAFADADACNSAADQLIIPLNLAALDVCEGALLLALANCLLL